MGKQCKQWQTFFPGLQNHCRWCLQPWHWKTLALWKKDTCSLEESYDQPRQHIKKQRHYSNDRGPSSQGYGFSSSHVWMWELDHKEGWLPKNWCFWTVVLEKALESSLDCKEIKPVNPIKVLKEISPEYSLEGLMLKMKLHYLGHLMWRTDSLEKTLMLGKIEGRRRREGMTEDEVVGLHHWLQEHEFEQAPGVDGGQGSLVCCSPWGCKELDKTEWLNWTKLNEYWRLVSFRIESLDILAEQGILKSLFQNHSSKHQFFGIQPSLWSNTNIHTWLLEKP